MASEHTRKKFEEALRMSLKDLGLEALKREQRQAIESVVLKRKDVLAVLPTGFGKSLIYQVLPGVFDYMAGKFDINDRSVVLVISPLNALMRDQISKLNERGMTSFMVQGQQVVVVGGERESLGVLTNPLCRILFVHPEVCVENRRFFKLLKSAVYQERLKCVVVDEAHLIKEW